MSQDRREKIQDMLLERVEHALMDFDKSRLVKRELLPSRGSATKAWSGCAIRKQWHGAHRVAVGSV